MLLNLYLVSLLFLVYGLIKHFLPFIMLHGQYRSYFGKLSYFPCISRELFLQSIEIRYEKVESLTWVYLSNLDICINASNHFKTTIEQRNTFVPILNFFSFLRFPSSLKTDVFTSNSYVAPFLVIWSATHRLYSTIDVKCSICQPR